MDEIKQLLADRETANQKLLEGVRTALANGVTVTDIHSCGVSQSEIAQVMKVSRQAVHQRLQHRPLGAAG
jgi:hypothetical protein